MLESESQDELDKLLAEAYQMLEHNESNESDKAIARFNIETINLTRRLESAELKQHLMHCSNEARAESFRELVKMLCAARDFREAAEAELKKQR
jgi:hypothetical protein